MLACVHCGSENTEDVAGENACRSCNRWERASYGSCSHCKLKEILKTHEPVSMKIDPESCQAGRQVILEICFKPKDGS